MASNRRLSAHDAVFLHWERDEQPFHVCECMVYAGKVTAFEMIKMLEERMHLLPRYRQRVVFTPMALNHPTWEDDPEFEVKRHVDEAELPAPGDDRTLSAFCGGLFCHLIDREHPLWHMTVIHGHSSGNTVVFLKLHHAMVDGVSSVELIEVLHNTTPSNNPPPSPDGGWQPKGLPNKADLVRSAVADQADTALDLVREVTDLARPGGFTDMANRLSVLARTSIDATRLLLEPPPPTPFNKVISAARDFCWLELPIDEVHAVRKAGKATVNDLVLAILAGGLGRYMRRENYKTKGVELRCMCPVSVRAESQSGTFGNQISMVAVPLHVGIENGLDRLDAEIRSMRELKAKDQAGGFFQMIAASKYYPAWWWQLLWKEWPMSFFPFNIVSTNVPGPREPLYLGTHELLHWYPFGVNWTTSGLFLCTLSYRQYLILGLVADPKVVSDVWEVNEDLRASYEDIKAELLKTPNVGAASA
jgi:WS/DGAT/MGAT family acyltransferase